jgi:hypothetical protein
MAVSPLRIAAAGLLAATLVAGSPVAASATAVVKPAVGTQYFVDCSGGSDSNTGTTTATAWHSLAKVNSMTYKPGDVINFRRGTSCAGQFIPQGSGTSSAPISARAYGTGAQPQIVATAVRAAVYLHNVQGWEIHDLDVSDSGPTTSDPRTGIYVELTDYGVGSHYVIDDVTVHNVVGCDCTNPGQPSGGIVFNADGSTTPSGFSGITVTNNTVKTVDGIGIGTSTWWAKRSVYPTGPGTYVPITGVLVQGNTLTDLGGDGINITNGVNALIQKNVINGFGLRATTDHAGIWSWNSDGTLTQYNDIGGGNAGTYGAFAFDVDGGDNDVLYQYNFTHDNSGMMLLCATNGMSSDSPTIRYNVSQNDRDVSGGVVILACSTQTNVNMYDNDVYAPTANTTLLNMSNNAVHFSNNIFVGKSGGSAFNDPYGVFNANLYDNVSPVPSGDANAVVGDPGFVSPGTATSRSDATGYKLACGSPALHKGAVISGNGGLDFFGNAVPSTAPNIGAYQGACV